MGLETHFGKYHPFNWRITSSIKCHKDREIYKTPSHPQQKPWNKKVKAPDHLMLKQVIIFLEFLTYEEQII